MDRNTSGLLFTCLSVRTQKKGQQIGANNLAVTLIFNVFRHPPCLIKSGAVLRRHGGPK